MGKKSEEEIDLVIRPQRLRDFHGQKSMIERMEIYIETACKRDECLDHVLLSGPPGLGKTTLAHVIAIEMGGALRVTNGSTLQRIGDVIAMLVSLREGDILFIDEIHRIPLKVSEVLYSAMEDYVIDIVVGKGTTANHLRIPLPPFTLVGATTRYGGLSSPLRDRFGIIEHFDYYEIDDLVLILERSAMVLALQVEPRAVYELARRSRGTPRVANRLLKRVRDFAQFSGEEIVTLGSTILALRKLDIDECGLDPTDRYYLEVLVMKLNGGPVGIEHMALMMTTDVLTLEEVTEPYLIQSGFVVRTSRGRKATDRAYELLGVTQAEV